MTTNDKDTGSEDRRPGKLEFLQIVLDFVLLPRLLFNNPGSNRRIALLKLGALSAMAGGLAGLIWWHGL